MPRPVGRPAMAKRTMFRLDAQAVADLAAIREAHRCATDAEAIRLALRLARAQSDTPRTRPAPPSDPSTSS
jgi:uncharacterized membrane protein